MPTIKAREGQCLFDIAMQESGNAARVFDYAIANGLSITELIAPGEDIETLQVDLNAVVKVLKREPNYPASDMDDMGTLGYAGEGIGYWYLYEYVVG